MKPTIAKNTRTCMLDSQLFTQPTKNYTKSGEQENKGVDTSSLERGVGARDECLEVLLEPGAGLRRGLISIGL